MATEYQSHYANVNDSSSVLAVLSRIAAQTDCGAGEQTTAFGFLVLYTELVKVNATLARIEEKLSHG